MRHSPESSYVSARLLADVLSAARKVCMRQPRVPGAEDELRAALQRLDDFYAGKLVAVGRDR